MDAIQEINIDLANYDTTIAGGTGAVINAVTKSGTNEFHGTVYGSYRDKDMVRSRLEGDKQDFNGFEDEKTYGMTFGGPIVRTSCSSSPTMKVRALGCRRRPERHADR